MRCDAAGFAAFAALLAECREVFNRKLLDYGPVWLVFRRVSLADQVFIKLCRLRSLEEAPESRRVEDTPRDEYIGIVNYCIMALMKEEGGLPPPQDVLENPRLLESLPLADILRSYDGAAARAGELLERKNHDYGEAWKDMDVRSITDQMLVKILRIKHMLSSRREMAKADSLPAQFMDILNYSLFSLCITG